MSVSQMVSDTPTVKKAKLYISHSGEDTKMCHQIASRLGELERENIIELIYNKRLKGGDRLERELAKRLQEADIILFLISPTSLTNKYISELEIPMAKKRAHDQTDAVRIVPVVVRPCDWQTSGLTEYNFFKLYESVDKYEKGIKYPPELLAQLLSEVRDIAIPFTNNAQLKIDLELKQQSGILNLSSCNLPHIPPEISKMDWLTYLDLSSNQIAEISNIQQLKALKILYLTNNVIYKMEGLEGLASLQVLYIDHNNLGQIKGIETLKNLGTLQLSHNMISSTKGIEKNDTLTSLYLEANLIEKLEGFEQLKLLMFLSLKSNQIKEIDGLDYLKKLTKFNISDNPIENCPADIWQSNDIKQIRAFFDRQKKSQSESKKSLKSETLTAEYIGGDRKDVKLILLGNSNAGKSNLVHYLQKNEFIEKNRNSTHGLAVINWQPDATDFPLLANTNVSIWDFGGQEYYHDAYKLFMSANAVYVVLWEKLTDVNGKVLTRLQHNGQELPLEHFEKEYWLYTVNAFRENNGGAPLLIAQNKIDAPDNGKQRLSQQIIDYFSVTEDAYISLKNGCDESQPDAQRALYNFKKEIENCLFNIQDKSEISPAWNKIRDEIQRITIDKKGKNRFHKYVEKGLWISLQDFINECEQIIEGALSEDEKYTLPRWLDRGGSVVYFANNEFLNEKVFVNPKQLSDNIYGILNHEILDKGGVFTIDDLNGSDKELMLEILQSLDLVFRLSNDQNQYIAPQYLPEKHAIEDLFKIASVNAWENSFWIKLPLFYYKKVMNYLLLQMINEDCEARYYWKHGIVFIKNNLRVLIKGLYPEENQKEGILQISVENGDSKNDLLKDIIDKIINYNIKNKLEQNSVTEEVTATNGSSNQVKFNVTESIESASLPATNTAVRCKDLVLISHNKEHFVRYLDIERDDDMVHLMATDNKTMVHKSHFKSLVSIGISEPKNVFISYSHQNTEWLNKLQIHLSGLRKSNKINDWTDKQIRPGEIWDKKIIESMEAADVFICLLSADFIASEYIWDKELKHIFENLKKDGKQIIFIYVEPFDLPSLKDARISDDMKEASIYDYEIIPKNDNEHLLAASLWPNENDVLARIVAKVREAIDR